MAASRPPSLPAPRSRFAPLAAAAGLAAALAAVSPITGPPARAAAAELPQIRLGPFEIHPAVGLEERYDSNVFLEATGEEWDSLTRVTGRLDIRMWRIEAPRRREPYLPGDPALLTRGQTEALNEIESVLVFPSDLAALYAARSAGDEGEAKEEGLPSVVLLDVGYQADGWLFARNDELDTLNQSFSGLFAARLGSRLSLAVLEDYFDRSTSTGDPDEYVSYASGLRSIGADFDQNTTGAKLTLRLGNRTFATPEYLFLSTRVLSDPFQALGYHFHRFGLQLAHSISARAEASILYQGGWIQGQADEQSLRRTGLVPITVPIPFEDDPRNGTFHQGLLTAGYTATPRLRLQAQVGAQVRDFDEEVFTSYLDFVANAEARYRLGPRTLAAVRFAREPVEIASVDGTFLVRTGGELSLAHDLAEKIRLEAKGYYHHDVFDEQSALRPRGREDDGFGFRGGAHYHVQTWLSAGAWYLFSDRTSNVGSEDTMDHRASVVVLFSM